MPESNIINNPPVKKDKATEIGKNLLSGWKTLTLTRDVAQIVDIAQNAGKAVAKLSGSSSSILTATKCIGKFTNNFLGVAGGIIEMVEAETYISGRIWELQGKPSSSDLLGNIKNKGTELDHRANIAQSVAQANKMTNEMEETFKEVSKSFVEMSSASKKLNVDDALNSIENFIKGYNSVIPGRNSNMLELSKNAFAWMYDFIGVANDTADMTAVYSDFARKIMNARAEANDAGLSSGNRIIGTEDDHKNIIAASLKKDNTTKNTVNEKIIVKGGLKLEKFATGGLVDRGELFIAREAGPELVGMIGNSAAVMNNEQIVDAVARGVATAIGNQRVNINVDGKSLFDIIVNRNNAQVRQTGLSPLMG